MKHKVRWKTLRSLGRLEEALTAYDVAIDLDGDFAPAHSNRSAVLRPLGRIAEAEHAFTRAQELQGGNEEPSGSSCRDSLWKSTVSLKTSYQQADAETTLRVVLGAGELREAQ